MREGEEMLNDPHVPPFDLERETHWQYLKPVID
jgi:hypothetical protein